MALEIVDPTSTKIEHLASVDVQFSGTHIGGGIYLATNHNPDTNGRIREAIPQRSLNGEAERNVSTTLRQWLLDFKLGFPPFALVDLSRQQSGCEAAWVACGRSARAC